MKTGMDTPEHSNVKLGFAKVDITPRVGVELCGFGPYLNRHSTGIRDRLWARAMAIEVNGNRAIIVACDLIGIRRDATRQVRERVTAQTGLSPDALMICCSHTHSGPATGPYIGWGEADPVYLEILPLRIAKAAITALDRLQTAVLHHAAVPCEGIGLNREYDQDAQSLDAVLAPDWRPEKPEWTDTVCHVLSAWGPGGNLLGFASYFGCHPVVCCGDTRQIHGDFVGVATNAVERDHDAATGLFLQGAQGDVNSCVVHKPEPQSLLALDIIAGRYARAIRQGIREGKPMEADDLRVCRREVVFSRKPWTVDEVRQRLAESERLILAAGEDGLPSDAPSETRIHTVYAQALRGLLARHEKGQTWSPSTEIHGIRMGALLLMGSPFETFQAIKRDIVSASSAPLTLVMSFVNDSTGYAVDRTCATRGGYAADTVPLICGQLPYANIHDELVRALLALSRALDAPVPSGPSVQAV